MELRLIKYCQNFLDSCFPGCLKSLFLKKCGAKISTKNFKKWPKTGFLDSLFRRNDEKKFMLYFTKYAEPKTSKNKWKKIGGINIDAIILSACRDKEITSHLKKLVSLALKKYAKNLTIS